MKTRNGFVSNSSSCSFIVDFGKKIKNSKSIKRAINKDYLKDWVKGEPFDLTMEDFPYTGKEAEYLYQMWCNKDPVQNGRQNMDFLLHGVEDKIVPYPEYRDRHFKKHPHERKRWEEGSFEDRKDIELSIWNRYKTSCNLVFKKKEYVRLMKEYADDPDRFGFFSFGNESEFPFDKCDPEMKEFINDMRNSGLASYLFKGLDFIMEDFS